MESDDIYGYEPSPERPNASGTVAKPTTQRYPVHEAWATGPGYNEAFATKSYEYNRHFIPGLALGTPEVNPTPRQYPSNLYSTIAHTGNHGEASLDIETNEATHVEPDESMEDGELSEGEMEDIYEPVVAEQTTIAPNETSTSQPGLERAASYSPYLSPQELQPPQTSLQTPVAKLPTNRGSIPGISNSLSTNGNGRNGIKEYSQAAQPSAGDHIAVAKKQAQDAVTSLWQYNVGYRSYIDNGIDRAILNDLFDDLGLSIDARLPAASPVSASSNIQPGLSLSMNAVEKETDLAKGSASQEGLVSQDTPQSDPAESRKDRIARLLAAKGSQQTSIKEPPSKLEPAANSSVKAHMDKSKLIRQKMEALRKSREQAQRAKQCDADQDALKPALPAETAAAKRTPGDVLLDSTLNSDEQEVAPIPGLSRSSSSQAQQPQNSRRRALASELNETSAPTIERPFVQNRSSQPFLIDVTDDEDDADMELDSPELDHSALARQASPMPPYKSFRDFPALSDHAQKGVQSSPGRQPSPNAGGSGSSGRGDLDSMTKQIKEMKRFIAAAEARKRAKESRQGSPSDVTPPTLTNATITARGNGGSETGISSGLVGPVQDHASAHQSSPNSPNEPYEQAGVAGRPVPSGRSAASERLPVVEAQRRAQMLKLQSLRSQIARIEAEIAASIFEEDNLRREVSFDGQPGSSGASPDDQQPSLPVNGGSGTEDKALGQVHLSGNANSRGVLDNAAHGQASSSTAEGINPANPMNEDSPIVDSGDDAGSNQPGRPHSDDANSTRLASHEQSSSRPTPNAEMEEVPSDAPERALNSGDRMDVTNAEEGGSTSASATTEPALDSTERETTAIPTPSPMGQPISLGDDEFSSGPDREVGQKNSDTAAPTDHSSFLPYETPLRYFRAFRFHPRFNDSIAGGLRSLTYSNKIDVRTPLCPDQLAGNPCPRGTECEFQHFEAIQAPDDQILLQLGAYSDYEGDQKHEYINGLRQLLIDFQNRKVKDFQTISQGIIDYRARFHGDKSKILPLGVVNI